MTDRQNDIEFASPEQIGEYQNRLLRRAIQYLAGHSPFYRRMFLEHAINPDEIQTTDDLQRLPFTTKADLQQFNSDFLCVERRKNAVKLLF